MLEQRTSPKTKTQNRRGAPSSRRPLAMQRMRLFLNTERYDGRDLHPYVIEAMKRKAAQKGGPGTPWRTPAQLATRRLKQSSKGSPLKATARQLAATGNAEAQLWCRRKGLGC